MTDHRKCQAYLVGGGVCQKYVDRAAIYCYGHKIEFERLIFNDADRAFALRWTKQMIDGRWYN